jgi:phenylacetic acid degradation operon negative regulatory protein
VPLDDRAALVTRIHLVYSYRKFPFSDPDLPADLLPDDWPGARGHELFLALYEALAGPAQRYYSQVADGG